VFAARASVKLRPLHRLPLRKTLTDYNLQIKPADQAGTSIGISAKQTWENHAEFLEQSVRAINVPPLRILSQRCEMFTTDVPRCQVFFLSLVLSGKALPIPSIGPFVQVASQNSLAKAQLKQKYLTGKPSGC
jgi:hypothetical protein